MLFGDVAHAAAAEGHARRQVADAGAGLLGGIMAPLSGFSGLAPALWATLRGYTKDEHRAVLQNFNLAVLAATFAVVRVDRPRPRRAPAADGGGGRIADCALNLRARRSTSA